MHLYACTNLNTDACTNLHCLDCTRVHQLGYTRQGAPGGWRTSNWPAGCPQAISQTPRPVRLTIPLPVTAPGCTLQVCSSNLVHNQTNQVHIVHSQTNQVTWSRCTMNHLATCAKCGKLTCRTVGLGSTKLSVDVSPLQQFCKHCTMHQEQWKTWKVQLNCQFCLSCLSCLS